MTGILKVQPLTPREVLLPLWQLLEWRPSRNERTKQHNTDSWKQRINWWLPEERDGRKVEGECRQKQCDNFAQWRRVTRFGVCWSRGKIYKCRITLLCAETKKILYADDTSIMIIKKESIDVYTTQWKVLDVVSSCVGRVGTNVMEGTDSNSRMN